MGDSALTDTASGQTDGVRAAEQPLGGETSAATQGHTTTTTTTDEADTAAGLGAQGAGDDKSTGGAGAPTSNAAEGEDPEQVGEEHLADNESKVNNENDNNTEVKKEETTTTTDETMDKKDKKDFVDNEKNTDGDEKVAVGSTPEDESVDITPFGVGPQQLYNLVDPKSIDAFNALGGAQGIAKLVHTDLELGLSYLSIRGGAPGQEKSHGRSMKTQQSIPYTKSSTQKSFTKSMEGLKKTMSTVVSGQPKTKAPVLDARDRIRVYGNNKMPEPVRTSLLRFMIDALKDKTLIVLCIAAAVEIAVGIYKAIHQNDKVGVIDGVAIIIAVMIVVIVSAVNDFRKQAQFRKLNDFSKSLTTIGVIRDGKVERLQTSAILVGDILALETGDVIPADGVFISGFNLDLDESSLTGEPISIHKNSHKDPFLLSGTKVVNGMGKMLVISTGVNSMSGRTMLALEVAPEETPLQHKLGRVADDVAKFGVTAAVIMIVALLIAYFCAAPFRQRSGTDVANDIIGIFITAITLVVVAVPEGLPLAVTLSLAHATIRMLDDQNMVRHLSACETMGNATTICSDKTGTLTINKMTVVAGVCNGVSFSKDSIPEQTKANIVGVSISAQSHNQVQPSVPGEWIDVTKDEVSDSVDSTNSVKAENASAINNTDASSSTQDDQTTTTTTTDGAKTTTKTVKIDVAETLPPKMPEIKNVEYGNGFRVKLFDLICQSLNINSTAGETTNDGVLSFTGSKTEIAIIQWTNSLGHPYAEDRNKTDVRLIQPFSSERKRMSTVIANEYDSEFEAQIELSKYGEKLPSVGPDNKRSWMCVKGASEILLRGCTHYFDKDGKIHEMDAEAEKRFMDVITSYSSQALRTISAAIRPIEPIPTKAQAQAELATNGDSKLEKFQGEEEEKKSVDDLNGLILCCLFGIQDPVRTEVPDAVSTCIKAGIMVRMVTGDNENTARAIAKECGILTDEGIVMEGPVFRNLTEAEMDNILPHLQVLARSSPLDKQVLVRNLKRLKETVAVTGDGTNDAPALKGSDVGFSMGITGTEVAKEASDIVILDDNFASIVKAVLWGRSVYDSVRKFLQFQLTVNVSAVVITIVTAIVATTSNMYKPASALTAVQLLWVNLIMDTLAALALATDPPTPELLNRKPSRRTESIINLRMYKMIIGQAIYQIAMCLVIYFYSDNWFGIDHSVHTDNELGVNVRTGTVVFNSFVFCQIFNEINSRSITRDVNIFKAIHKNYIFMGILVATVFLQAIIVQYGGVVFKCPKGGLAWKPWLVCIAIGAGSLIVGFIIRLIPDFETFLPKWMIMKRFRNVIEESALDAYDLSGYEVEGKETVTPEELAEIEELKKVSGKNEKVDSNEQVTKMEVTKTNSIDGGSTSGVKLRPESQRKAILAAERASWNTNVSVASSHHSVGIAAAAAATAAYNMNRDKSSNRSSDVDAPIPDLADSYADSLYAAKGLGGHHPDRYDANTKIMAQTTDLNGTDADSRGRNAENQSANASTTSIGHVGNSASGSVGSNMGRSPSVPRNFYTFQAAEGSPSFASFGSGLAHHGNNSNGSLVAVSSPALEEFSPVKAWNTAIRRTQLQLRVIRAMRESAGKPSTPTDSQVGEQADRDQYGMIATLLSDAIAARKQGRIQESVDEEDEEEGGATKVTTPTTETKLLDIPEMNTRTHSNDVSTLAPSMAHSSEGLIDPTAARAAVGVSGSRPVGSEDEENQASTSGVKKDVSPRPTVIVDGVERPMLTAQELWDKARAIPRSIGVVNALRGGRRRNEDLTVMQMVDSSSVRLRAAQQQRTANRKA